VSNKRTKQSRKKGPARAPRDVSALPDDAESEQLGPATLGWLGNALKIVLGLALLVGTAAALAWGAHRYAMTTPRFAIQEIVVEGTRRLSRDQLLALGGIRRGDNVFSLDVERAEQAVLDNPWVESARILRRLPGEVRIEIHEREARALVVVGGKTLLVSEDGLPFKQLEPQDPHDLPLVTGLSVLALARDEQAELEQLQGALGLLGAYERLPFAQAYPAEEVHLDDRGHAVLTIGSQGTALHLGAGPWKQKLLRAGRILAKAEASGSLPGVIFLDNEAHPERVVVRVK